MSHKAGFINIIGNPNVGKSTLLNALVGERISIITKKAQTTRHRILGIVNEEEFQMVFSDLPGVIKPAYELQENMMQFVKIALQDADVLLYLVEIGETTLKDENFFKQIEQSEVPVVLLLNKIDKADQEQVAEAFTAWKEKLPKAEIFAVSALMKFGVKEVFEHLKSLLPDSPPFYAKDAMTDKPERFFVNETIREKILIHYKKEIPYSVEVETESFENEEKMLRIHSVIMVERKSQKGIIIGHQGRGIKRIGTEARKDLEKFFQKKIHLELFVKVNKDWRKNRNELRKMGYDQSGGS
jgi:GTP-binding protein Era